ncbi:growth arrest and DNA damage-inducible protein GADD45 gamma-like [Solea senegalensis]|uniref:Growth arrest and DNA damage-inducible protein GADD45 gamma-like n=1 Tax=Solea senegalensis TaxID=28829 RepID=A0AAV6R4V1_SOLSE|nr:growth arrest and DNA damage-inducible protein GADD45 gamma-like [Solea senegalensis]
MTLEEVLVQKPAERDLCMGQTLEDALVSARDNESLTVGVYECAKVMNLDPDSVSFCVLAVDEQFECDIALQIHFTLIQSFCFDNDISIVRVGDAKRLSAIVGDDKAEQLEDAHCVLITVGRRVAIYDNIGVYFERATRGRIDSHSSFFLQRYLDVFATLHYFVGFIFFARSRKNRHKNLLKFDSFLQI